MTILGLYVLAGAAVIGGLAVDLSHLIAARTQLQMTADLVAHGALYNRDTLSAGEAKDAALAMVATSMPSDRYGDVISAEDIVFGSYDYADGSFAADLNSRSAVMVTASLMQSKQNSVGSFLMQFVGISDWDVQSQAVFATFRPACLREGFVAEGIVDIQSNNGFSNGFCIHSNTHVSLNSNNTFEAGTVVSMPDLALLDLPRSGFETNSGLETALREGRTHIRVLNRIDEIYAGLFDPSSEYFPSYITDTHIYEPSGKTFTAADLLPGRMPDQIWRKRTASNGLLPHRNGRQLRSGIFPPGPLTPATFGRP